MFWLMLIFVPAGAENASQPHLEAQEQHGENPPHGIQVPTAPYPELRHPLFRRAHYQLPPAEDAARAANDSRKQYEELFGKDPPLGPYPPLADLKGHKLSPPTTRGYQSPKEETWAYLTPRGQGILDGLALVPHLLKSNTPFRPGPGPGNPLGVSVNPWYLLPVPTYPSFAPRLLQGYRPGPWSAGAGSGRVPTPLGPYPPRRLRPRQMFPTTQAQTIPAPLRAVEYTKVTGGLNSQERGRGFEPLAPTPDAHGQFGPLAPPALRSAGGPNQQPPPHVTADFSGEGIRFVSLISEEETRPTFKIRGLPRFMTESTPPSPPPLLGDEDRLLQEAVPDSEDRSNFEDRTQPCASQQGCRARAAQLQNDDDNTYIVI
ncbi:uncharacterized protein LOC125237230 isoform X2 [Leguminivora glycinivorella]|uniref:uncharacterized protein LOC125237230 isoform X2 n=1 Tax=Leguminivora glycinivorella TaxID=1035111 RepID=UPI0020102598|nr:uncharacterized protein LOC125237230 isoform X2 [Leguminivora glycinivorella]